MSSDKSFFPFWKFTPGSKVKLRGMKDAPERNGEIVTIFGYRPVPISEHCPSGRAYYILEDGPGHFLFEERLELA